MILIVQIRRHGKSNDRIFHMSWRLMVKLFPLPFGIVDGQQVETIFSNISHFYMRFKLLSQHLFLNTVNKINSIFHSLPLEKEINFYFSTSCFLLDCPYFSPSMMELPNQTTLFNSLTIYLMGSHYQGRITSPTDKISMRPPKLLKTDKRCARKRGRKILFPP